MQSYSNISIKQVILEKYVIYRLNIVFFIVSLQHQFDKIW